LGDQQAGLGAFFFEERVSAHGGAVAEKRNVLSGDPLIDQFLESVEYSLKRLLGCRGDFGNSDFARVFVKKNEIGKRAPRVNGNSIFGHVFSVYH
jgi:hypothetical protein